MRVESRGEATARSLRVSWLVLWALFLVSCTNVWSRSMLPYYYVSPQGSDQDPNSSVLENLPRWEYGLLYSGAFSIPFTISLLISKYRVEKSRRIAMLISGVSIRSLATALTGFAVSDWEFFATRAVMGIGEGMCTPAAYSLIADNFPDEKQDLANAIFGMGTWFGLSVASLSMLVSSYYSWKEIHWASGVLGAATVWLLFVIVREPLHFSDLRMDDEFSAAGPKPSLVQVIRSPFVLVVLGTAFRMFGNQALSAFLPTYYSCEFPDRFVDTVTPIHASLLLLGGPISGVIGAKLSAWMALRHSTNLPRYLLLLPIISGLISVPALFGVLLLKDIVTSLSFVLVLTLTHESWYGGVYALLQGCVPPQILNIHTSFYFLASAVISSVGPVLVGLVLRLENVPMISSEKNQCTKLSYTLILLCTGSLLLSCIFFTIAARVVTLFPIYNPEESFDGFSPRPIVTPVSPGETKPAGRKSGATRRREGETGEDQLLDADAMLPLIDD